jgi:hypothetical protein
MDLDAAQRTVLGFLLESHPRMLGMDDLRGHLPDIDGIDFAVARLADDGLASRVGDRVGVTRAAVRYAELDPI